MPKAEKFKMVERIETHMSGKYGMNIFNWVTEAVKPDEEPLHFCICNHHRNNHNPHCVVAYPDGNISVFRLLEDLPK